ncbi:hypothetical protein AGMMS50268_04030 [Spirochaetia bacterium]|nr:hypothetical protein AGMMS50268_04030 [Spirochaetia bacterium]
MSVEVPELAVPVRAQKLVSEILGDLESSMQRAAHFFKSGEEAYDHLFMPMALMAIHRAGLDSPKLAVRRGDVQYDTPYRGERRDLLAVTQTDYWIDAIQKIRSSHITGYYNGLNFYDIKPGDYLRIPIKVPPCETNGLKFGKLDTVAEAVVADVINDKIIFQFEEILFFSAINRENTSKGGFQNSDLSIYLNDSFMSVFGRVKEFMVPNKYGKLITLPTKYEIFGEGDDENGNWNDGYQLEYFKKIKNRIRTFENDTRCSWTSTPAGATTFAYVGLIGVANYNVASYTEGGVAPAFCIS